QDVVVFLPDRLAGKVATCLAIGRRLGQTTFTSAITNVPVQYRKVIPCEVSLESADAGPVLDDAGAPIDVPPPPDGAAPPDGSTPDAAPPRDAPPLGVDVLPLPDA